MTASVETVSHEANRPPRDWVLIGLWISLVIVAIIWIAPFVFIVFTSLKSTAQVTTTSAFAPPADPQFVNYARAWARGRFDITVVNSAIITAIKVPLGLFLSAMAAYALAKIPMRFGKLLLLLVLFGTMIPFQVMLAPIFTLVNGLGLIDRCRSASRWCSSWCSSTSIRASRRPTRRWSTMRGCWA